MAFGKDLKALVWFWDNERKIDTPQQPPQTLWGKWYYPWDLLIKNDVSNIIEQTSWWNKNDEYIPGLNIKK